MMGAECCGQNHSADPHRGNQAYRRVLWAVLAVNAVMFAVEIGWAYRGGDANMRSAWICIRNDVLGNVAVLSAALGVFGTGTGWPDIIVGGVMAALALQGCWLVMRQSLRELRQPAFRSRWRDSSPAKFAHIRFAPIASKTWHRSEMMRCANRRHGWKVEALERTHSL